MTSDRPNVHSRKNIFLSAFLNTLIKFSGLSPSFPRPPRRLPRPLPCLPSSVRNIKTMALGCTALILKMFCTFQPFSFYISSPPALNQVDLDLLEKKNNYMASCWDGVEGGDNNDDLEEDNNGRDNYDEHDDIGGDDDDRSVFF